MTFHDRIVRHAGLWLTIAFLAGAALMASLFIVRGTGLASKANMASDSFCAGEGSVYLGWGVWSGGSSVGGCGGGGGGGWFQDASNTWVDLTPDRRPSDITVEGNDPARDPSFTNPGFEVTDTPANPIDREAEEMRENDFPEMGTLPPSDDYWYPCLYGCNFGN